MLRKFFLMAPEGAVAAPAVPSLAGAGAFDAIDALATDDGAGDPPAGDPPPAAAPDKPVVPDKPAEKPPEKPATKPRDPKTQQFTKPAAKPAEKPAAPATPPKSVELDFDNPPGTIGDLRKHYDALKSQFKELQTKHGELQKTSTKPQEWPEKKTYEERLAAEQKRLEQYETELRYTRYEKSAEYKEKYEAPYVNAYVSGRNKAAAMKVIERKNEADGSVIQPARQGTAEDFDMIMGIRDDDAAADKAAELYGARAPMILFHRERAQELQGAAQNAIKEYQTKGAEWEKQQREVQERQFKEADSMIGNFRTAAVEKYPALFKEIDGDAKGNELLQKGGHLLERVLQGGKPLADGEEPMTQEELAIAIAAVRNKAAGFDRLLYQYRTTQKERDALKKDLEAYQTSEPKDGSGRKSTETPPAGDDHDPFKKLDSMAREV